MSAVAPQKTVGTRPIERATSISAAAAPVPTHEAAEILRREYDICATPRRLVGERDQNFAFEAQDGAQYTLKLINPAEDPEVTNFQTSVLLHIEKADPSLPVQRVLRTLDGLCEKPVVLEDGTRRMMRVTSYLPGIIVRGLPPSAARAQDLGRVLARSQLALEDFSHPADGHEIAWDIRHASWQRDVLPEIEDVARRGLMERGLDRFEARALPGMTALRSQVVHNDLSGDNVVVDPADTDRVSGLLDFGDATRTAVANDLAIGLAYNLHDGGRPLEGGLPLLAGFHAVRPVLAEELDLLLDLVIARMIVRTGITEWRARRFPENREYILRNTSQAWRQLEALLRIDPADALSAFRNACSQEP